MNMLASDTAGFKRGIVKAFNVEMQHQLGA